MSQTPSYVHGVGPAPLLGLTVDQLLERTVESEGDSEALVVPHEDVRWSWRELREQVDGVAAGLLALGSRLEIGWESGRRTALSGS